LSELESRIQAAEKKVSDMSSSHESLEREFRELKNMCGGLIDQADATTYFTVPELQDRVEMLEQQSHNKISSLTGRLDEICGKFKADTDLDMDIGQSASKQLESMRVWEAGMFLGSSPHWDGRTDAFTEMKKTVEEVMKNIGDSLKSVKDAERAALESLRNAENGIKVSRILCADTAPDHCYRNR
jgi:predicted transcriptional regulator